MASRVALLHVAPSHTPKTCQKVAVTVHGWILPPSIRGLKVRGCGP
jgi:hypothetical protein